jgi:nucleoid-associated protein YgaU
MQITVAQGDSLWSLAKQYLGSGMRWPELWRLNRPAIEREQLRYLQARRHMRGPDWIFDGMKLEIPVPESQKESQ